MTKRYSIAEAKNHLPAVVHEAEAGHDVEITRHGRPVAVLLSIAEHSRLRGRRPDLWAAYQAWRAGGSALSDEDVEALADETRGSATSAQIDW